MVSQEMAYDLSDGEPAHFYSLLSDLLRIEYSYLLLSLFTLKLIIDGSIISIKNPYSGSIVADHVDEIIIDDNEARCEIKLKDNIGKP